MDVEEARRILDGPGGAMRFLAKLARERGLAHVAELGDLPPLDLDNPVWREILAGREVTWTWQPDDHDHGEEDW